ncbi:hypothetical protein KKB55_07260 [Myxococcota bacterium]|nr:hypothetical protein [Myxococcota bacterium]
MRSLWFFLATALLLSGCVIEVDTQTGEDASEPEQIDGGSAGAGGEIEPPIPQGCEAYGDPARCAAMGCAWGPEGCVEDEMPPPPPPPHCDQPDPASCEAVGCVWSDEGCVPDIIERDCEAHTPIDCVGVEGCHLEVDGPICGPDMDCMAIEGAPRCVTNSHPCHELDLNTCIDRAGCAISEVYVCADFAAKAEGEGAPRMEEPSPACWTEQVCVPYERPIEVCQDIVDWDACVATPGCAPVEGVDCDCTGGRQAPPDEDQAPEYPGDPAVCYCFSCQPTPIQGCEAHGNPEACEADPACAWSWDAWDGMCDCGDEDMDCMCEPWGACLERVEPIACEAYETPEACQADPACALALIDADMCSCVDCDCGRGWVCSPREPRPDDCAQIIDPEACFSTPACDWAWLDCGCPEGEEGDLCLCDAVGYCFDRQATACEQLDDPDRCEMTMGCAWTWGEELCSCDDFGDCSCELWGSCGAATAEPCQALDPERCWAAPGCDWVEEAMPCECAPDDATCACLDIARGYCAPINGQICEALDPDSCQARPDCELLFTGVPCDCPDNGEPCACPDIAEAFCVTREVRSCETLDPDSCQARPDCELLAIDIDCVCADPGAPCDCPTVEPFSCVTRPPQRCGAIEDNAACLATPGCALMEIPCQCVPLPGSECDCIQQFECVDEAPSGCQALPEADVCEADPACDWIPVPCACPDPSQGAPCGCVGDAGGCFPASAPPGHPCEAPELQREAACVAVNGCGWIVYDDCDCPDDLPPGAVCDCALIGACVPIAP